MAFIRTVLGDIPPEDAGVVLTHEHTLIFWPGADLDHRAAFDQDEVVAASATSSRAARSCSGSARWWIARPSKWAAIRR